MSSFASKVKPGSIRLWVINSPTYKLAFLPKRMAHPQSQDGNYPDITNTCSFQNQQEACFESKGNVWEIIIKYFIVYIVKIFVNILPTMRDLFM